MPMPWDRSEYARLFATTEWPVVKRAGTGDSEAQTTLYRLYARPVYSFLRRKGRSPEDAEDLVQSLFLKLFAENKLAVLSPENGRLRTWLMRCAENLLRDDIKSLSAARRGAGQPPVSWQELAAEDNYRLELVDHHSPQQHYDRSWAESILEHSLGRLRQEFEGTPTGGRFGALKNLLIPDQTQNKYADVAASLGISEQAIKGAVWRLRQRLREILVEEVSRTVSSEADVNDELRHLFQALCS